MPRPRALRVPFPVPDAVLQDFPAGERRELARVLLSQRTVRLRNPSPVTAWIPPHDTIPFLKFGDGRWYWKGDTVLFQTDRGQGRGLPAPRNFRRVLPALGALGLLSDRLQEVGIAWAAEVEKREIRDADVEEARRVLSKAGWKLTAPRARKPRGSK